MSPMSLLIESIGLCNTKNHISDEYRKGECKVGCFLLIYTQVPENHLVVQICLHLICIDLPLPRELRVGFPDVLCDCDLLPAPVRGGLSSPLSHSLQDLSTSHSQLKATVPLAVGSLPL